MFFVAVVLIGTIELLLMISWNRSGEWAQYARWHGKPFPADFSGNRPVKAAKTLKIRAFPVMALFLSLLFFEVSTMPYGDCSLSKKFDDGGHRPLNSVAWRTSMAVVQARVLRFSRLRIRGKGTRTPAMPVPCSDHDEAGGGNLPGSLDVFPAVLSKRLCEFHGYSNYEGISSPAASVWRTRRVVAGE